MAKVQRASWGAGAGQHADLSSGLVDAVLGGHPDIRRSEHCTAVATRVDAKYAYVYPLSLRVRAGAWFLERERSRIAYSARSSNSSPATSTAHFKVSS